MPAIYIYENECKNARSAGSFDALHFSPAYYTSIGLLSPGKRLYSTVTAPSFVLSLKCANETTKNITVEAIQPGIDGPYAPSK